MKTEVLRDYIRFLLEEEKDSLLLDEDPTNTSDDVTEFSGVGAGSIVGFMAPSLEKKRK